MQDPRAALGGKARVGPVGVAEAVLLDHAIFGDVLRTERGLGALGARNGGQDRGDGGQERENCGTEAENRH